MLIVQEKKLKHLSMIMEISIYYGTLWLLGQVIQTISMLMIAKRNETYQMQVVAKLLELARNFVIILKFSRKSFLASGVDAKKQQKYWL